MQGVNRKTAVVTGAASGLGRAFAVALGKRGWKIALADIDSKGAEDTCEMVRRQDGTGIVFRCDVTSLDDLKNVADYVFDTWGGLDLLINNAGLYAFGAMGEFAIEQWKRMVDVNLWGVINGCHIFIPRMKMQHGGHIINIASGAGIGCVPFTIAYNTTKAGVIGLSETLYAELAPSNIGVTVVCPSWILTNVVNNMVNTGSYTKDWQREFAEKDIKKGATAEEVVEKVLRAAEKKKIYVFPQTDVKLCWIVKRMFPTLLAKLVIKTIKSGKYMGGFRLPADSI